MATQNKITEILAAIKTIYPYYAKDTDVSILVKLWSSLLCEYPDKIVDAAFYKALQSCKMPPTPAEIIENIKAMTDSLESTDEELWGQLTGILPFVNRQLHRLEYPLYPNTKQDERAKLDGLWDGLNERLKQYLGSKGELMRIARDYSDDDLKFEKNRFLKTMPLIKERQESKRVFALLEDSAGVAFGRLEGVKKNGMEQSL